MLQQQQKLARIEVKIDEGLSQLKTKIEKMGTEMHVMFGQLLDKDAAKSSDAMMLVVPMEVVRLALDLQTPGQWHLHYQSKPWTQRVGVIMEVTSIVDLTILVSMEENLLGGG